MVVVLLLLLLLSVWLIVVRSTMAVVFVHGTMVDDDYRDPIELH